MREYFVYTTKGENGKLKFRRVLFRASMLAEAKSLAKQNPKYKPKIVSVNNRKIKRRSGYNNSIIMNGKEYVFY